MAKPPRPFSTAVGKKIVMALTGLALCIFLVSHLAGNLILLLGAEKYNRYSQFLISLPIIVPIEWGLAAIFVWHVLQGLKVWQENKSARPERYQVQTWARAKSDRSRKSLSSTTMITSGTIVLAFVIWHVLTFKYGPNYPVGHSGPGSAVVGVGTPGVATTPGTDPAAANEEMRDLADLVNREFHKPLIVALYVLSMLILGLHLYHAVSSSFQSLGADHPRFTRAIILGGRLFTIVIAGGFALLPLWVYFAGPRPPGGPQ